MPSFSLRLPDAPRWHVERDYSPAVARALTLAYAYLRRNGRQLKGYSCAANCVRPIVDLPMSARQRTRVAFVLSLAPAAAGDYCTSLFWLDEALDLASQMPDQGDLIDLLYLRGPLNRAVLHFSEAVEDYQDCLALLRADGNETTPTDAAFELEVVSQLAGFEFFLARYESAERLLQEARGLAPLVAQAPEHRIVAATLAWLEAHLYRWRGQPELALRPAAAAAEVYTEASSPASAARSQMMVADVALDLAERFPDGMDRYGMLRVARPHVQLGLRLARAAHDEIGQGMARLTQARYSRLAGRNEDRIALIEQVARTAQQRDDEALLAQAFTALGDELAALGEEESALNRYREVLAVLDGSDVPALGIWAHRALHHFHEHRID